MSVLAMVSAALDGKGAVDGAATRGEGAWRCIEKPRIALGAIERRSVEADGGDSRFAVALAGAQVYTVEVQPVPRGTHTLVSLYGPSDDLIGCEGGWGRVCLVQAAPTSAVYSIAVEVGPGGEAFVLRVVQWTEEEVERAIEDPLFLL